MFPTSDADFDGPFALLQIVRTFFMLITSSDADRIGCFAHSFTDCTCFVSYVPDDNRPANLDTSRCRREDYWFIRVGLHVTNVRFLFRLFLPLFFWFWSPYLSCPSILLSLCFHSAFFR